MIRIGTSGWSYGDWRERFYPKGVAQRNWLSYYAQHFDTVELNATTYRLPKASQIESWCSVVPEDFLFTVKLSRLITHRKALPPRLDEFIFNYMERIGCFARGKLAQLLCQFPPYLQRDDERLEDFLNKLPAAFRYVAEFRNKSWFAEATYQTLRRHNMAFCIHDYPGLKMDDVVTSADLAYVRFHGHKALYAGSYPRKNLRNWSRRIEDLRARAKDVFIYFNNDTAAAAIADAKALRDMCSLSGPGIV